MQVPSSISRILFSSPDFIIDKNKAGLSGLKSNQIVEAKVAKVLSDGKAQLIIKGETVSARTHVLLKENEVVKLKVVADGDTKVLRLVKNTTGPEMPEGLKEMRAFGRSGLYSKLIKSLVDLTTDTTANTSARTSVGGAPSKSQINTGEKFQKTEVFEQFSPKKMQVKSDVLPKISNGDLVTLRSFLNDKTIPFSQKVSAVLVAPQHEQPVVPQKVTVHLAEKLLSVLNNGKNLTQKLPAMTRLSEAVDSFRTGLSPNSAGLLDRVADIRTIPFEYKLLSTLTSEKNVSFPEESAAVQKFLLKGLEQKGFNITVDFPGAGVTEAIHSGKRLSTARQLETLLDNVSLRPENIPDGESMKAIVRSSGLMWESRVKAVVESLKESKVPFNPENLISTDIKALAMKLVTVMEGEDRNTANTLRSFVDGLEKMQLLNRQSFDESGRYLLPLPFFSEETLKFGQMLVDLDRDNNQADGKQSRAIRVAFILEMSRLGNLRADFAIYKKSVSGTFGVENIEVQTLINGLLPGLTEALAEKGYQVKKISCEVIPSGELVGASLTDMVLDNTDGLLNIVV